MNVGRLERESVHHRARSCAAGITLISMIARGAAIGQSPPPKSGGSIVGVVFDSLVKNAPIAGAEVTVDGRESTATTDSRGQFRLDGIPPGPARVRFYHAMLDSLGFGAPPVSVTVPDSGVVEVRLVTPSPERVRASLCPGSAPTATGVILGLVRNVDDRAPLTRATVTASWSEWSVGANGLVRSDRQRVALASDAGAFALCGVPNDVPVAVRATSAGHVTGILEVNLAKRLFAVRDLAVSLADAASSADEIARLDSVAHEGGPARVAGASSVRGTVRGADGKVLANAQIDFLGLPLVARSGSDGRFGLTGVPSGTQTLQVRAVGYAPLRLTLNLETGERRQIEVGLARTSAQALAAVTVVGKGTSLDRTGFADRRRVGVGQFITEEEIARRGSFETTHILYNARGAFILGGPDNLVQFRRPVGTGVSQTGGILSPSSPGGGVLSGAVAARLAKPSDATANGYETRCFPAYFLDGFLVGGDARDVNILVRPYQIRGIEVYQDPATAPAEYRRPEIKCAIVLIWTKPLQGESTKTP